MYAIGGGHTERIKKPYVKKHAKGVARCTASSIAKKYKSKKAGRRALNFVKKMIENHVKSLKPKFDEKEAKKVANECIGSKRCRRSARCLKQKRDAAFKCIQEKMGKGQEKRVREWMEGYMKHLNKWAVHTIRRRRRIARISPSKVIKAVKSCQKQPKWIKCLKSQKCLGDNRARIFHCVSVKFKGAKQ